MELQVDKKTLGCCGECFLRRGSNGVLDPIPCFLQPISMRGCIDIALELKDPRVFSKPHKLDLRDGVVQDNAGALHPMASIHRLTQDHYFLGLGRERRQCPHVDDYAEGYPPPAQGLFTFLVPFLEFRFRNAAAELEEKSQIDGLYFVHLLLRGNGSAIGPH